MNDSDYFRQPKIYATTLKEKRQYDSRKIIFWVILVVLLLILAWFLFFSSFFKIKKIIVSGSLNNEVSTEINQFIGRNLLTFRVSKIEKDLAQKQTSISSLQIFKGLPDTLKVKVNVREPKLLWVSEGKDYYIDENGIVFELSGFNPTEEEKNKIFKIIDVKNAPVVTGTQIVSSDFVKFVTELNNNFNRIVGANITETRVNETTFQVEVVTDQNWRVYFDATRNLNNQLVSLKKIIDQYRDQIHEYVDLRVEGRAYYK